MAKLSATQVEEYFSTHLPYRTRILVAHYWMTRKPWTAERGDVAWLQGCFEASLITGRMYLNVLGISKNRHDQLTTSVFRADDVSAEDLGGRLVDVATLPATDRDLFVGFLKMADKGAAHLTTPMKHSWEETHTAISRICHYLKVQLYGPVGKTLEKAVP
jgi:lipopolysaccharide biosynthesis glycosyltransferase